MKYAYVRVSTVEQNEERQVEALKPRGIDKWFVEKVSAKNTDREQLQAMLAECQSGDEIYIHDFSRLARSTKDLLNIVDILHEKGVTLVSNKENIDTGTPTGKLMLTMIGAISEFERLNMLERQREGIILAKRRGAYNKCGRKKKYVDQDIFELCFQRYKDGTITKRAMAATLGISRPTLDKLIAIEDAV